MGVSDSEAIYGESSVYISGRECLQHSSTVMINGVVLPVFVLVC